MPIRDEDVTFSPAVDAVEYGHRFTISTSRVVAEGRYYLNQGAQGRLTGQTLFMAVYAAGTEDESGPIRSLIIPCNNGAVTGGTTTGTLANSSSVADALQTSSDVRSVNYSIPASGFGVLRLNFATNQYAQILQGKRILGVNLLYAMTLDSSDPGALDGTQVFGEIELITGASTIQYDYMTGPSASPALGLPTPTQRLRFGEVNHLFDPSTVTSSLRMPWTYDGLKQWELGANNGIRAEIALSAPATGTLVAVFRYAALEVVYCEDKRVILGGAYYDQSTTTNVQAFGLNSITMRSNPGGALNPTLAAGTYDVTVYSADMGDLFFGTATSGPYPEHNALRELYQIPPHPGVQVNAPFPPEFSIGKVVSTVDTHVLVQLSLHASGSGTMTEPHAYGRQVAAQVYGANTATQVVQDGTVAAPVTYQQVRYYARRFGDTTVPLTFAGVGLLSGSTVSITVADFDALTEILDGWREVTLRFAAPPTMSLGAGNPSFIWSAPAETAGNRWEILGASAPAISGSVPGTLFAYAPNPNALYSATYQPPSGDTAALTWMPQGVGSPYVSGASIDFTSDAVFLFSVDPPTVTGFTLTARTQTVTGIGLDCASLACCIPSGIAYQQLTWSATTLPATGFGAYELQRFDTAPGGTFQTIMLATNPAVTGFNDFEARVGITSVYRIRALNILNFAGSWSAQVSGAPPIPGVTGGCTDSTGALIFTSNAGQSGYYNAAYVMQWENSVTELFTLPEADMVEFQPMYNRDGVVAFHGTERGLETFTRDILLQAAAIDPIRLADARGLRDLAWANLPYVCVRDDIGDRWYANVRVPTVNARLNRTKYMARIEIVEATTTPYPVNP